MCIDYISRLIDRTYLIKPSIYGQTGQNYAIIHPYSECGKEVSRAHDGTETRVLHTGGGGSDAQPTDGQCNKVTTSGEDAWIQSRRGLAYQQRRIRTVHGNSEEQLLQKRQLITLPTAEARHISSDWNPSETCLVHPRCLPSLCLIPCHMASSGKQQADSVHPPRGSAMQLDYDERPVFLRTLAPERPRCKEPHCYAPAFHDANYCAAHLQTAHILDLTYARWQRSEERAGGAK